MRPIQQRFPRLKPFSWMAAFLFAWSLAEFGLAEDATGSSDSGKVVGFAPLGPKSWPSFRNGNLQTGVATSDLPDELDLLWTHEAGEMIVATAAIIGDHVYVASLSGEVLCLDRKSGNGVWSYKSIKNPKPNEFLPGFQAAPTVTADSVYLGDEDGVFHAIDRATGTGKWTFKTDAEIHSAASVVGDNIIFGSYDYRLYCLNRVDGSLVWRYETENYVNGSPAIVEDLTFVTGCDAFLRAINIRTGQQTFAMDLGTYIIASPAIYGDELYVGTSEGELLAVNWKKQSVSWTNKDPNSSFQYRSSAAVNADYVVVGGRDKRVHCLERKTGQPKWTFPTRSGIDSSPVIVGKRVFVGSGDRNVYGLDLETGKEVWSFNAGDAVSASCAVGEGCLVIGSESRSGNIYCFGKKKG